MSDHSAFISAICTHPDEDTVREVFADWLEEQGEGDRAEFIRLQCELARWKADDAGRSLSPEGIGRHTYLKRREEELWNARSAWAKGWVADGLYVCIDPFPGYDTAHVEPLVRFARGFGSEVRCSWADWRQHATSLAWHPKEAELKGCPACGGTGYLSTERIRTQLGSIMTIGTVCEACSGKGWRCCPVTALPGVRVTLADPIDPEVMLDRPGTRLEDVASFLKYRHPGVREFVLRPDVEAFVGRMIREGRVMPVVRAQMVAEGRQVADFRTWAASFSALQPHPMFRERGDTWELTPEYVRRQDEELRRRLDREDAHERQQRIDEYSIVRGDHDD